jgi:glutamate-1-semialdehyde 2,1-aminomutase
MSQSPPRGPAEEQAVQKRSLERSNRHFKRAVKSLPLGVTSNFRYWGDDKTIYVKRGKGPYLWDIDDNRYIDYRLGYGPAILGYADPRVDAAAREGLEVGGVFALATEREAIVAERIQKMVPAAERVRFSNSGTEAVMAALRVARAHTKKDSYVLIEGGYHGMFDGVLWESDVTTMSEGQVAPELKPYSAGVPSSARELIHCVPLNDANWLEDVLRKNGDQIGALLIEPIMGNCGGIVADVAYVRAVRELCDRYDVVMIVDEVKTGFRVARGGVQELMGFSADLCTFAKAMGNGYPISALAGREEFMKEIGSGGVAHGGTYSAHSVSLAAAEKTLEILDETDTLERIHTYGRRLETSISEILNANDVPHVFAGHPSMASFFLAPKAPTSYRDWAQSNYTLYEALAQHLHDRGILCEPDSREPWFISSAHDEECMSQTIEAFGAALEATLKESRT